jgi:hypothetical protein
MKLLKLMHPAAGYPWVKGLNELKDIRVTQSNPIVERKI